MSAVLLADGSAISFVIADSGIILYGTVLVLLSSAVALSFLLRNYPTVSKALTVLLVISLITLLGIVSLDLVQAGGSLYTMGEIAELSELFSTHRWLLIQLPILLHVTSIAILATYGKKIAESFAREYRFAVVLSVLLSFVSVVLIGIESMF